METWTPEDRIIAPSLLAADLGRATEETARAVSAGADWLHLDVMDGHFVDNITFGPDLVRAVKKSTGIFLDVHLMISRPDLYLPRFLEAGADLVSIHLEAGHDPGKTLARIRGNGALAGLAINPATPLSSAEPFLAQIEIGRAHV